MSSPALSQEESCRIEALRRYDILDTSPEEAFDDVVRLASFVFRVPIALVSLVDSARQWFKAKVGLDVSETPREGSFCSHAILRRGPLVVPDALRDERFANSSFVLSGPGIRFYAGAPLVTPDGFALGALCVLDRAPREFPAEQAAALEAMARTVMAQLELRRAIFERDKNRAERDLFFDLTPDVVVKIGLDGMLKYVNRAGEEVIGYASEEALHTPYLDYVHPEDRQAVLAEVRRIASGGSTTSFECRLLRRDGSSRWFMWSARGAPPEPWIFALGRDVTDRKAAEKERALLAAIVESSDDAVFGYDLQGSIVSWNPAAETIFGYSAEEMRGRTILTLVPPDRRGEAADVLARVGRGERLRHFETVRVRKDGRPVEVSISVSPIRDASGRIVGASGIVRDLTERRRAETALQESEERRLQAEELARNRHRFENLVGRSAPMQEVYRKLRLVAQGEVTVLLAGESGTGKELAAGAIHALSARKGGPFVAVNCSAIPEALLESELFGHVKGAFTGAVRDKAGLFEAARGGTLFLDEVGDMPPALQVKVLRALQEREIRRVGDEKTARIDVRVVAATNRDLKALLASGALREDFYYRIRVFEIVLPPLRERREDIPLLVEHFLADLCGARGKEVRGLSPEALRRIMDHPWPGNVRELRNALDHALVTVRGDRIETADLPPELRGAPHAEEGERLRLEEALRLAGGSRAEAAKILGVSRVTLWKRMKRLGLAGRGEKP